MKTLSHPLSPPGATGRPSSARTLDPAAYLDYLDPSVRATLTPQQLREFERVVGLALPRPAPKLIDLRFTIDLLISRYFIVLMMGKDRRRSPRHNPVSPITQIANWVMGGVLLLGFNLSISAAVVLLAYLIKSALGIDLLPGHLGGIFGG